MITPARMVLTGVQQEDEMSPTHRSPLIRIVVILAIKVKIIIRKR